MVISRLNLKGWEVDLAGAATILILGVASYALLLHAPLQDAMGGSRLQEQQAAATRALESMRTDYRLRVGKLSEARERLTSSAGWLGEADAPSEVLARINEFARQCDVRIARWQPQGVQVCGEYQEQVFVLAGEAAWPALVQWLALIEQGVPLLDLTHFTISANNKPGQGGCEFSCSLKLYRGNDKATVQVVASKP